MDNSNNSEKKYDFDIYKSFDICSNSYKIKYNILMNYMQDIKYNRKIKHVFCLNVGDVLTYVDNVSKFRENTKDKEEYRDFPTYAAITTLNVVAHYKHFFDKKIGENNSIILYCSDEETYEKFDNILVVIADLLKFIPHILYIPSIGSESKHIYNFLLMYALKKINIMNNKLDTDIHIHLFSSNKIDLQAMGISKYFTLYKRFYTGNILLNKIDTWNNIIMSDSKMVFQNPENQINMGNLVAPILSLTGFDKFHKMMSTYKGFNKHKRVKALSSLLWNIKNDEFPTNANTIREFDKKVGNVYTMGDKEFGDFLDTVDSIRYEYSPNLMEMVTDIMKVSSSKLKDVKINNINDMANVFEKKRLSIEWLLGK